MEGEGERGKKEYRKRRREERSQQNGEWRLKLLRQIEPRLQFGNCETWMFLRQPLG